MGLRSNKGNAAATEDQKPATFEDEGGAAVMSEDTGAAGEEAGDEGVVVGATRTEEEQAAATRQASQAQAGVEAAMSESREVAAAPKRDLAAVLGSKYTPALNEFRDVIDPSSIDFDTFPRLTVGLDGFSNDAEDELGKQVKLRLMSWNERYIVTAGEDNDEANALTKFSLDGKTLDDDGSSAQDYLKVLKETEGYEKAAIKKYYQLYGFLLATSETGKLEPVPAEDQSIVSVQIPPRSVAQFTRFQIEDGVKVSQGVFAPTDELVLTTQKEKGKTKSYAKILFSRK